MNEARRALRRRRRCWRTSRQSAAESLGAVWEHTQREGVDEPGAFPVAPDLVEALVALERLDEAREVTARLRDLSEAQEHPWGLAGTKRSAALLGGYDADAARLRRPPTPTATLGLRFDRARTLLSLGRAQRRVRKWGAARSSLEQAAAEFERDGLAGLGRGGPSRALPRRRPAPRRIPTS